MAATPFLIGVLVLGALVIGWAVLSYNALVKGGLRADEAWSTVAVHLKRRASLVPNLVETVSGYATHERETLEALTLARRGMESAAGPSQAETANATFQGALGRLLAVAEAYPDLKASTSFMALQKELSDLEEKIAFARQFYNRTVLDYNALVRTLPSSIIATGAGFTKRPFFELDVTAQTPPVRFHQHTAEPPGGSGTGP